MDAHVPSKFLQMPDEVLAIVLGFVIGPEAFLLSATCSSLCHRLTRKELYRSHTASLSVTRIYERNPTITLPLQTLSLFGLRTSIPSDFHVGMLPPTITCLMMYFPDCYERFIVPPVASDATEPYCYPHDAQTFAAAEVIDFKTRLPLLAKLECNGDNIFIGHKLLPKFPSSLTSLSLAAPAFQDYSPCFGPVPPNLLDLALENAELLRETLLSNSTQLESLRFGSAPLSLIPRLPPSLQSLRFVTDDDTDIRPIATLKETNLKQLHLIAPPQQLREILSSAPPSLADLTVISFPCDGISFSPSLTRLYLLRVHYNAWDWDLLPPTLKKLTLHFYFEGVRDQGVMAEPFPSNLPPSLELFEIENVTFFASSLPSGLGFTASMCVYVDDALSLANLPQRIDQLGIRIHSRMPLPTSPWPLPAADLIYVWPVIYIPKGLLDAALPGRDCRAVMYPLPLPEQD